MVDGVSGSDLYRLVLDASPVSPAPVPDDWQPRSPASGLSFTTTAILELATSPAHALRGAATALSSPRRFVRSTAGTALGMWRLAAALRPVHHTSLTGSLDGSRRYAWTEASLSGLRCVREAYGVTVNDVALAAIAGGFRRLLESRGESPDPHALRSLVPVSMREPGEESIPDNRVSLLLPYLPVDIVDPVERLQAVHRRIRELQASHEPLAGDSITTLAAYGPFPPVSEGIRIALRLPQRQVATVTTNVPGPHTTLYALGRELQELLPYVPIADRVRIGVAIHSYRDALTFGLTGDYDGAPDLDALAEAIRESLDELMGAAHTHA
jgi:WS/DGAT/MGAT family acyltransferase